MKQFIKLLLLFLIVTEGSTQNSPNFNVDSVSTFQWNSSTRLNDIWGYVDSTGVEYALVGRRRGLSIVSLADTLIPAEVYRDTSVFSTWRDIKTWKKHAYVINESGLGLEIYDLSNLPASVTKVGAYTGVLNPFVTGHNLYVDSMGVLYIFGTNNGSFPSNGTVMLDVDTDPKNPIELGKFTSFYLHDGVARNNILYGGAVNNGLLLVIDVNNKANPTILGSRQTPNSFTHNVWLSDNGNSAFTTDEKSGAYVAAYDVTNPQSIVELDRIRSRNTTNVIPHNTHVLNDFLVTSYYTLGVSIIDGSKPDNLVEVGYFDTSPFTGGTFNGNWGAYPYLPSGLLILSDMEQGLFVVRPHYKRAAFFEGRVLDCNNNGISQAQIEVLGTSIADNSNLLGEFKFGGLQDGYYSVRISAPNYTTRVLDSVELRPAQIRNLTIQLQDSNTGFVHSITDNQQNPIDGAFIKVFNSDTTITAMSSNGLAAFPNLQFGTYQIEVSAWGYANRCIDNYVFGCTTDSVSHLLNEVYEDNFNNDLGWSVSNATPTAIGWNRATPRLIIDNGNVAAPSLDDSLDCGNKAFLTIDNLTNTSLDTLSILSSSILDLSNYNNPYLNFSYWLYNSNSNASDFLEVALLDTLSSAPATTVNAFFFNTNSWVTVSYRINDFMNKDSLDRVEFRAMASRSSNKNVYFGVDNFSISEGLSVGLEENSNEENLLVYPNPFKDIITLRFEKEAYREISIYSMQMQLVFETSSNSTFLKLSLDENNQKGVYILMIKDREGNVSQKRIVKL